MFKIFIKLENDLFGCFRTEEERDNHNETVLKQVLKEREGIAIETTGLPLRDACSFSLLMYTYLYFHAD